jgi:hypothetical protein
MLITLIVLVAIAAVILQHYGKVELVIPFAGRAAAPIRSQVLPVPARYKEILQKYFPYYQKLSPADKTKFQRKVTRFVSVKRFIPRDVDIVTVEAKVLIAASAVQLTFGLPNIYLQHFNKILVYPNDYYSSITRQYHRGEVNPRFGIIVLSWQSFVNGYINPSDSFNVGLHEMAHALRLENVIRNEEYNFFDRDLLNQLDTLAHEICSTTYDHSFLRAYACTNTHEFFAVCVENFFERPAEFKTHLPQVYAVLAQLLRQDPAATLP